MTYDHLLCPWCRQLVWVCKCGKTDQHASDDKLPGCDAGASTPLDKDA